MDYIFPAHEQKAVPVNEGGGILGDKRIQFRKRWS